MAEPAVVPTDKYDSIFWSYNLPLQMWKHNKEGWRCLNYMPRRERCDDLGELVSAEELPQFCANTVKILQNLATLFEMLGRGEIDTVYYPNEDPEEAVKDAIKDREEEKSERPGDDGEEEGV